MNSRERVFIGIGSNIGRRRRNCLRAIKAIDDAPGLKLIEASPFYETEPWGLPGQRAFVNAVLEVRSNIGPMALLMLLKGLERDLGRERGRRWGPRVIDLDILFFGRRIVDEPRLTVPHPRLHERAFVMVPLGDIAPEFIHPIFLVSIKGLLNCGLKQETAVKRLVLDNI